MKLVLVTLLAVSVLSSNMLTPDFVDSVKSKATW